MKYDVDVVYTAKFVCEVDAINEGEAYDKARDMAENADIRQFVLGDEVSITYRVI